MKVQTLTLTTSLILVGVFSESKHLTNTFAVNVWEDMYGRNLAVFFIMALYMRFLSPASIFEIQTGLRGSVIKVVISLAIATFGSFWIVNQIGVSILGLSTVIIVPFTQLMQRETRESKTSLLINIFIALGALGTIFWMTYESFSQV